MLHTQYRPKTWAEFIGNDKAVKQARGALALHDRKLAEGVAKDGLAFIICGLSGAGKTSAGLLLAKDAGGFDVEGMDYAELDGDKCNADAVRALDQNGGFFSTRPWGRRKVLMVGEFHGMTPKAVQAWLTLLERLPKWAVVIFTSTESPDVFGNFAGPFARRCVNIGLSNQGLAPLFADRLVQIGKAEGYDLSPKVALRLVQDAGNSMGRAIEELGKLIAGELVAS